MNNSEKIETAIADLINAKNSDCLLDFPKNKTIELAIAALEKQREMEPNALTLDELQEWNANIPFYIEGLKKPYASRWVLLDEPMSSDKYWMTHAYHVERYGKEWIAYDREPSNRKDD